MTTALRVFFFIAAGLAVLAAALRYQELDKFNTALRNPTLSTVDAAVDAEGAAINAFTGMMFSWLVVIILLLVWGNQAYKAASQGPIGSQRWSSGWAVGGWFIPFANLVIPKLVFNEIDRMSNPMLARPLIGERWRNGGLVAAGNWWWFLLVVGVIGIGLGGGIRSATFDETLGGGTAMYRNGMWVLIAGLGAWGVASLAGAAYVKELGQRLGPGGGRLSKPTTRPRALPAPPSPPSPPQGGSAVRCPFCAEPIQPQAIVCRWCGRDLPEGAIVVPPAALGPPQDSTGIPASTPMVRTVTEPGATLRDAPSGGTVTHLSPGTRVTASEQSGAWVSVVAASGVSGWVRESELIRVRTPAAAPRPAPVVVSQASPGRTWRVSEPGVSLMNSPDGTAVVARLTPGTKVVEVGSMGRHIRVTAPDGRTGWLERRSVF